MPARRTTPIITFLTDFGDRDAYVAAMKAAVLRRIDRVHLVDITHAIAPQDVTAGAFALERAVAAFPAGTIHVAVVDPGVGTDRRLLLVEVAGQHVLCPDNGLVTWAWRRHPGATARALTWRPDAVVSSTFHGRDILAPAAALLAGGRVPRGFARPAGTVVLLDLHPAPPGAARCRVIHVDRYGNATTNLDAAHLAPGATISVARRRLGPVRRTYADVPVGAALALVGSAGLLEIAVRDGSAATTLRLGVGDPVSVAPG